MAKVKPETKTCKHCATEIPYTAKVCPNCRKKVKGGKLKWIIIVLVVIAILGAAMGGGDDKKADTQKAQTASQKGSEEAKTEEKIVYNTYDCTELFDELKDNALKAEKNHQDEYVEITGYLGTIDSDGSYIGLAAAEDDYNYMFDEIRCDIKTDDQLDQVMEMKKGDKITVKGQIKSIGEVLGYSLNIEEIK
ncbi:MAG: hypothetical protein Q4E53_01945 [Eubacteriales bacterium]|nr:hypothetical protein [Eubacteriales bacterium]